MPVQCRVHEGNAPAGSIASTSDRVVYRHAQVGVASTWALCKTRCKSSSRCLYFSDAMSTSSTPSELFSPEQVAWLQGSFLRSETAVTESSAPPTGPSVSVPSSEVSTPDSGKPCRIHCGTGC